MIIGYLGLPIWHGIIKLSFHPYSNQICMCNTWLGGVHNFGDMLVVHKNKNVYQLIFYVLLDLFISA